MGRASRRKRKRPAHGGKERSTTIGAAGSGGALIRESRHSGKVSEALTELVGPFVEVNMGLEDYRSLLGIGAIAWNLSLLKDTPVDDIADLLKDRDEDYRAWFEAFVADLIARKKRLFPDDDRFIAKWDVSLMPNGDFFVAAAGVGVE